MVHVTYADATCCEPRARKKKSLLFDPRAGDAVVPVPAVVDVEVVLPDVAGEHEADDPEEHGVQVEERRAAEHPGLGGRAGVGHVAVHVPDVVHGLRRRRPHRRPGAGRRDASARERTHETP